MRQEQEEGPDGFDGIPHPATFLTGRLSMTMMSPIPVAGRGAAGRRPGKGHPSWPPLTTSGAKRLVARNAAR